MALLKNSLFVFLTIICLSHTCVNKNDILNNLSRDISRYENAFLNKDLEAIISFTPEEVHEEIINQSNVDITTLELKNQLLEAISTYYSTLENQKISLFSPSKLIWHNGRIFCSVRLELSGNLSDIENSKFYKFQNNSFVLAVGNDSGKTFKFVVYENEKSKQILDVVYKNITSKFEMEYSSNDLKQIDLPLK